MTNNLTRLLNYLRLRKEIKGLLILCVLVGFLPTLLSASPVETGGGSTGEDTELSAPPSGGSAGEDGIDVLPPPNSGSTGEEGSSDVPPAGNGSTGEDSTTDIP